MKTGMAALARQLGEPVRREQLSPADQRLTEFDEAAEKLVALISEESGLLARTRARQILWGIKKLVEAP